MKNDFYTRLIQYPHICPQTLCDILIIIHSVFHLKWFWFVINGYIKDEMLFDGDLKSCSFHFKKTR